MTLIYTESSCKCSLTVPNGAVLGLRFKGGWFLYVNDPESGIVKFRVSQKAVSQAADDRRKLLNPEDGEDFVQWLCKEPHICVEKQEPANSAATNPQRKFAGPSPSLGLGTPAIQM